MHLNRTALRLAGATLAALSVCAEARAQVASEEIVVTARRVEERLQDAPLSVTVVDAAALEDAQIAGSVDLDQVTPSLQIAPVAPISGNNSAAQMFIRGIGQTDPTAGVDPGVGLYIDGVYMGWAVGGILDFHDIANVQVLRGPQGTLFGRNTVGGAILIASTDPGERIGGAARAAYGDDNLYEGFLALDLPVSQQLRTRFTVGRRQRDGYVIRSADGLDLGDENTLTLTGKAVLDAGDDLRIALRADYTKEDENGAPLVFAGITETAAFPAIASVAAGCPGADGPPPPFNVPMIDDPRCANDFWNDGPNVANGTFPVVSTLENWGAALTLDWDISDALRLTSITGARSLAWHGARDADNTPLRILHTDYRSDGEQLSQEFQLTYRADPLTLVSGLYFFRSKTVDQLLVSLAPAPLPDHNNNVIKNENWAAFAQATFDLSDALSASLGVRYTKETKSSLPGQYNDADPANVYVLPQVFARDFASTIGSASLRYRWNDALMTYASWSQGFKSGGFNSRFNAPVPADPASGNPALSPPSFGPENAESFEIGAKIDPSDALRLNLAAFSTTYDDIQLTYRFGVAPYIFNAGEATIQGFEAEARYTPTPAWSFDANVSYLDDQFDSVADVTYAGQQPATLPVTLSSQLPYVPEWQGGAAAEYAVSFGDHTFSTRGEVIYVGAQFFDTGNTPDISQTEDVTTYNLGFVLEPAAGPWALRLALKNITDEVYPVAGNSSLSSGAGYAEIAYNRGRETVLSLSTRF